MCLELEHGNCFGMQFLGEEGKIQSVQSDLPSGIEGFSISCFLRSSSLLLLSKKFEVVH